MLFHQFEPLMERIVYFKDKTLIFTSSAPSAGEAVLPLPRGGEVSRAKVLKILETCNTLTLQTSEAEAAFERFAAQFTAVEAAGGVVVGPDGRFLLIYRNGRWDLPKGHVEAGESFDRCAVREIAEETGVEAELLRPLCETRHAYWFEPTARWELKRTHWYLLRTTRPAELQPQHEEGIERVVWCDRAAVRAALEESYPTIRAVFAALQSVTDRS